VSRLRSGSVKSTQSNSPETATLVAKIELECIARD
jgi:hypothetical protein